MTLNLTSSLPLGFEHETRPRASKVISETVPPSSNNSSVIHCMLAGGLGGAIGDSVMHSLDTVKTRQQGAPNVLKYRNTFPAFTVILKEEGVRLGLYGGYTAAMLGSFPSAALFFGTYEYIKRLFIRDFQFEETATHLSAGFLGDLASSVFYVPSEVLKTRLQLQGRFNNPHFQSGYNYKNTFSAASTIIRNEGWRTLFFGYKATLFRDLPFSALQFAFYEKFRAFALNGRQDLSIPLELATGAGAGGLAGILTTPLDVIKTRIQTQNPSNVSQGTKPLILSSNSIYRGLYAVGKTEGVVGLFSGVGPRFIWTSVQSSIMLLLYQVSLRTLDGWFGEGAL